ncbi:MAG: hypothetical protein AAF639_27305 [Chloroflexota bacterium]
MYWKKTISNVVQSWQASTEEQLEMGQRPLVELGVSHLTNDALHSLVAYQLLYANRHAGDGSSTLLLSGGHAVLWLAALFDDTPQTSPSHPLASQTSVIYAGADHATYMGSLSTMTPMIPLTVFSHDARIGNLMADGDDALFRNPTRLSFTRQLPTELASWFIAIAKPSVPTVWSALPFAVLDASQLNSRYTNIKISTTHSQTSTYDPVLDISAYTTTAISHNNWLAWTIIALVIALFLLALIA